MRIGYTAPAHGGVFGFIAHQRQKAPHHVQARKKEMNKRFSMRGMYCWLRVFRISCHAQYIA
jgi:hypothetical protein